MFLEPAKAIAQFELDPGMKVVDLGSGSGFYSYAIAKVVGKTGKVYAVDVQKELLDRVVTEGHKNRVTNIEVIWGDIEKLNGTKLASGTMDAALLANTLFQVENKRECAKEIYRILKPGGKLMVIDWSDSFGGLGPPIDHVVLAPKARGLFEYAGFSYQKDIAAGAHHYGMIFTKVLPD